MKRFKRNKNIILISITSLLLLLSILVLQTTNSVDNKSLNKERVQLQESETKLEGSLIIAIDRFNEAKNEKEAIETKLFNVYDRQKVILGFQQER